MERRKFLHISAAAAVSLQTSMMLGGCGGGSGGSDATQSGINTADDAVRAISSLQDQNRAVHTQTQTTTSDLLQNGSSAALFDGFAQGTTRLQQTTDPVLQQSLQNSVYYPQSDVWTNYQAAYDLAHTQAHSQVTKLQAALRVYGAKGGANTAAAQTALYTSAQISNPTLQSAVDTFLQAIADFKNQQFGAVALDGLTLAIKLVFVVLEGAQSIPGGSYYSQLAFAALRGVLEWIEQKALSNISFSSDTNIVFSLAKMAIAVVTVLGIQKLDAALNSNTATALSTTSISQDTQAQLEKLALQSQLILTLTAIVQKVMLNVLDTLQGLAEKFTDPNYTLTTQDQALIAALKPLSEVLGILGITIKMLLAYYQKNFDPATSSTANTPMAGDAQTYTVLFGNPINSYDTQFSSYVSSNFATLFGSNTTLSQILAALSDVYATNANLLMTIPQGGMQVEHDAYTFASHLADLAYQFSSDTATQASDFATHMADLAYQFTMKIENDAYTFALKGMEYGYLFASKGESVGLMADRILWMAVQIGQMADRIGEMADRIVYTEQLIVYTEMLILDFGMLIYGGMKQISNTMLMGMAIVFDRQWYANVDTSNDPVLNIISSMTQKMLANMQEYELAVLANQDRLRNTTLKALDWIQQNY